MEVGGGAGAGNPKAAKNNKATRKRAHIVSYPKQGGGKGTATYLFGQHIHSKTQC